MGGANKEGGKAKPLKKPKGKQQEDDDDDLAFKQKLKDDAAKMKALKEQVNPKPQTLSPEP
jgi:hypothetical protein